MITSPTLLECIFPGSKSTQGRGLLQNIGGASKLCVHPQRETPNPEDDTLLVLRNCTIVNPERIEFMLLQDGRLKHISR